MVVERIARLVELDVLGQLDRQVLLRHRHDAALPQWIDRDRRSPSSAGATPASRAGGTGSCPCRRPSSSSRSMASPWRPRPSRPFRKPELIDHAVFGEGSAGDAEARRHRRPGHHHRDDRQAVFGGELVVALVVAGTAEDRAGAVLHQHEVGGIDRQRLARDQRMPGQQRQLVAELLGGLDLGCRRCRSCGIRR